MKVILAVMGLALALVIAQSLVLYFRISLPKKTNGSNSNRTLTITRTGILASLNISQSLGTITNSGTILGSIENCFDKGNLKGGVCSVGNWYGQPIIYANVTTFNNNTGAVIGSTLDIRGSVGTLTNAGSINNILTNKGGTISIFNNSGRINNVTATKIGTISTFSNSGTINRVATTNWSTISTITNSGRINNKLDIYGLGVKVDSLKNENQGTIHTINIVGSGTEVKILENTATVSTINVEHQARVGKFTNTSGIFDFWLHTDARVHNFNNTGTIITSATGSNGAIVDNFTNTGLISGGAGVDIKISESGGTIKNTGTFTSTNMNIVSESSNAGSLTFTNSGSISSNVKIGGTGNGSHTLRASITNSSGGSIKLMNVGGGNTTKISSITNASGGIFKTLNIIGSGTKVESLTNEGIIHPMIVSIS